MALKNQLIEKLKLQLNQKAEQASDEAVSLKCKLALTQLDEIDYNPLEEINIGSLVTLQTNEVLSHYFILPVHNTFMIPHDGNNYLIVGPDSLMAGYMIHLNCEDDFDVEFESGTKNYKIIDIS